MNTTVDMFERSTSRE